MYELAQVLNEFEPNKLKRPCVASFSTAFNSVIIGQENDSDGEF